MTIAELKKELEKYNDNDVIVIKATDVDPWSGHSTTTYNELAKFISGNRKVIKAEKWAKMNKED